MPRQLASWRWNDYSDILIFTFMIIAAGVLKLAYHHTPVLSKYAINPVNLFRV